MRQSVFTLVFAAVVIAGVISPLANASIIYNGSATGTTNPVVASGTGYTISCVDGAGGNHSFNSGDLFFQPPESVTVTVTSPITIVGFSGFGPGFGSADSIPSVTFSNGDSFNTAEPLSISANSFTYSDSTPFTSATFNFTGSSSQDFSGLFATVPEPTSAPLLGGIVVIAGLLARRRRVGIVA